jgi:hypothetical protein
MRTALLPVLALLCVFAISACSKTDISQPVITGTWKTTASYDDYGSSGQFAWHAVADSMAWQLQLDADGRYTYSRAGSSYAASYTFNEQTRMVTLAQPNGETAFFFRVSELSPAEMVADYRYATGLYRQRYVRVKN